MTKLIKKFNNQSGAVLIFAVLLVGIILSIGLALSAIFANKLRASVDAKNSVPAYYAADSGIEWTLFTKVKNPGQPQPIFSIGSEFEITEDIGGIVRSLGTFRGVSRAIEVDFGAFASGSNLGPSPTPTPLITYYAGWESLSGTWSVCNQTSGNNVCLHTNQCDYPSGSTCGTYSNGQSTLWWKDGYSNPATTITCRISTAPLSCP